MASLSIGPSGEYLTLTTSTRTLRFHAIWLRDNAVDSQTRAAGNGQRLIALRDIPAGIRIASAKLQNDKLEIEFAPESRTITYDIGWLETNAYDTTDAPTRGWIAPEIEAWDAALMHDVPVGDFAELARGGKALCEWLGLVYRYGFGKIINGPVEEGALYRVVDLFGYVRETNYGRHFEVRTEVNPTNLAFTGQGLQAHTDNHGLTRDTVVAFLGSIFDSRGNEEYLGEPVSMGEHMLQGATIAEQNNQPAEIIVGALLHDIGHFTSEFGTFAMSDTKDRFHETAGADLLQHFFPGVITDCVRHHVAAKRYLCATRPEYYSRLSEASVHSLGLQGGPMSVEEVAEFEMNPNIKQIVCVRYLDDAGKHPDMHTPDYWHFAPMVQCMVDHRG